MVDSKIFNHNSARAQKARLSVAIKPWVLLFRVLALVLFIGGVALLVVGLFVGWATLAVSLVFIMLAAWYKGELQKVVPAKDDSIDGVLDQDILSRLKDKPSPKDIATAIGRVNSGYFFIVRFGLGSGFLEQIVSDNPDDTDAVWREALAIRSDMGLETISSGVLILALMRQVSQAETLLARLQLDENALIDGIRWYDHLQKMISLHSKGSSRPGGIGRDWAFGWIPMLSRYGQNISEGIDDSGIDVASLESNHEALEQLVNSLSNSGSKSIALIGPTGAGKTEIVHALASLMMSKGNNVPPALKYHQVFVLDSSSLIASAREPGELEAILTMILNEAYAAKNIIICLDNAQLFMEDGVGSVDLTPMLLPILQAGNLPIILTIDEQRFLQISTRMPDLANAMNRINVLPANKSETLAVLQDKLPVVEYRQKVTFMYQALQEIYRLSERYIHDLVMPGRAIKLMEASAQFADNGLVTARSVQQAIEKTIGVKVSVADNSQERETLLNLESLIHERMIGQEKAVAVVSDALRRARAGVRNQNRPIGTFLFLGPTGVGKTELAKSLAAVYFGDENQIVRMDMNEFVSSDDVRRLIADGATDPGSLTAQIMKQPFSVVLLDELEKAHDSVLTTLLQMLDEGIMRDENNREVSFRDSIVIATSNAGADKIREYVESGIKLDTVQEQIVDALIDSNIFRPEFLNRFDEIVVFGPLNKDELMRIVDLIIAGINKTLELQKISVVVDDAAKRYLVEAGYDPRLGARPMRRVIQKTVENLMARAMLAKDVEAGGAVSIGLDDVMSVLEKTKTADQMVAGDQNIEN